MRSTLRSIYSSLTSTKASKSTTASSTEGALPTASSHYKQIGGSNSEHIFLTEIASDGFNNTSFREDLQLQQGIKVKRDVDVV